MWTVSSHYIKWSIPLAWDNFPFYSASVISFPEYITYHCRNLWGAFVYETQTTQTEHSRIDRTTQTNAKTQQYSNFFKIMSLFDSCVFQCCLCFVLLFKSSLNYKELNINFFRLLWVVLIQQLQQYWLSFTWS